MQLCLRVADVHICHAYLVARGVTIEKGPKSVADLGIRVIVVNDPEGYQIEIQSVVPAAA